MTIINSILAYDMPIFHPGIAQIMLSFNIQYGSMKIWHSINLRLKIFLQFIRENTLCMAKHANGKDFSCLYLHKLLRRISSLLPNPFVLPAKSIRLMVLLFFVSCPESFLLIWSNVTVTTV